MLALYFALSTGGKDALTSFEGAASQGFMVDSKVSTVERRESTALEREEGNSSLIFHDSLYNFYRHCVPTYAINLNLHYFLIPFAVQSSSIFAEKELSGIGATLSNQGRRAAAAEYMRIAIVPCIYQLILLVPPMSFLMQGR